MQELWQLWWVQLLAAVGTNIAVIAAVALWKKYQAGSNVREEVAQAKKLADWHYRTAVTTRVDDNPSAATAWFARQITRVALYSGAAVVGLMAVVTLSIYQATTGKITAVLFYAATAGLLVPIYVSSFRAAYHCLDLFNMAERIVAVPKPR